MPCKPHPQYVDERKAGGLGGDQKPRAPGCLEDMLIEGDLRPGTPGRHPLRARARVLPSLLPQGLQTEFWACL